MNFMKNPSLSDISLCKFKKSRYWWNTTPFEKYFEIISIDDQQTFPTNANISPSISSIPCMFSLENSSIPDANLGIFTKVRLPKGVIFGPFKVR